MEILYFALALVGIYLVVKIFSWPIKMLVKLLINGVLGAILLVLVNFVGSGFGISLGINAFTALIAGFFGVPGVIFLIVLKLFL
jgi:inhibitor of the pro-sigma K processing machinery